MKIRRPSRSIVPVAVLTVGALSACGASAPGANELAYEVIDTLEVPDSVKNCMKAEVDKFEDDTLDEIADRADGGDSAAVAQMEDFQAALERCN